ncbi:glycosyltransferase family 2 protein [Pseudomonadota bacterium]
MSFNSLISIVIPHFNRAELLNETLDSIKAQEYKNWEVLVVDDGSSDEQLSVLKGLATEQIRVLQRVDGRKGPSRCRNLGVSASKGIYVIFLDSDDTMAPWCLHKRMIKVEEMPEAELWVFPVLLFEKKPGDLSLCWNRLDGEDDLHRFLRSDPPWHTSSTLWLKESLISIGGFNEMVFYGDDSELHSRALLKNISYRKFSECLPDVFIRRSDEPRITNVWTPSLVESRKVRLMEGTQMLKELNAPSFAHDLWEGQYFLEGEELLFGLENSKSAIEEVIDLWTELYNPGFMRRVTVYSYFGVGAQFLNQFYLIVRVARRLAKMFLPDLFFPTGTTFQRWEISETQTKEIRKRLHKERNLYKTNSL